MRLLRGKILLVILGTVLLGLAPGSAGAQVSCGHGARTRPHVLMRMFMAPDPARCALSPPPSGTPPTPR